MHDIQDRLPSTSHQSSPWDRADPTDPPCVVHPERADEPGRVTTPHGDLLFLNVRGSFSEMAAELGRRMTDQIHQGAVPFFSTYLEQVLRKNSPVARLSNVLRWATHKWVTRRLEKNLPADFYDAVCALSHTSGVALETLLKAYLMPESFLWLLGTYHNKMGTGRSAGLGAPPSFGCTSAVVRSPMSPTMLHGRNFDYFGVEHWDKHASVVFYHPDDGLDYVAVSSAGILGGGITGMNAAGLTLVVHQHFVDEFDLDGIPVGYAGDQVMRHAHTLEEAVAILRDHPPVAGWTYVMTEGDTGRAAIYEVAPGKENFYTLPSSQHQMGYSNVYWGSQFVDTEVDYYPQYRRANHARQQRVNDCLKELGERDEAIGPVDIAQILGDFTDPSTDRERLFGESIANVNTVASVVFEPENRRVWVAAGGSPTSRNWYIPFRLNAGGSHTGGPDMTRRPFLPQKRWHHSAHGQAFELYRKACHRYWAGETNSRLLILIEHALALYPQEPNLHVLAGLLALRIGRAKRAEGAFRRALEQISNPARRAEIGLFLGWALDLQDQRGAAKYLYKRILRDEACDGATRTRARHGRWRRFSQSQAESLPLDFVYAGVP
jgi:hypothetical protein